MLVLPRSFEPARQTSMFSFLKRAQLHPYCARFFLAWSIIEFVAVGSVSLLLTGFLPQLFAGTSLAPVITAVDEVKGFLIAIVALGFLLIQSRLVFHQLVRRNVWSLLTLMIMGMGWAYSLGSPGIGDSEL